MNYTRKMAVVPQEQIESNYSFSEPEVPKIMKKVKNMPNLYSPSDKMMRIIRIALRLATINGYDENGNIRGIDGNYVPETNIINLLNYAVSFGKLLKGENEFVKLLSEANVPFEWIINENIKKRLTDINNHTSVIREPYSNTHLEFTKPENNYSEKKNLYETDINPNVRKRKISDEPEEVINEIIERKKKKINWENPVWREDESGYE